MQNDSFLTLDSSTSYKDFFLKCMVKNCGAIINVDISEWNCTKLWTDDDIFNMDKFSSIYGNLSAPVYHCNKAYHNSQVCETMKIIDFSKKWLENDLYLKDFHLYKKDPNFYETPSFFQSDWLNEYYEAISDDDYRFLYLGKSSTFTPFHADVLSSYSWSVNISGEKEWIFLKPGQHANYGIIKEKITQNYPSDVSSLLANDENFFKLTQKSGNAIFVPSNWYHQVRNVKNTVSCNHNWINGCNLGFVLENLLSTLSEVQQSIDHLRSEMENFDEHCQLMLKSLAGWDFDDFSNFLEFIERRRRDVVGNTEYKKEDLLEKISICENFNPTCNLHLEFDIACIKSIKSSIPSHF